MSVPAKDMTGLRFNRLVVEGRDTSKKGRGAYWFCRCECGQVRSVHGGALRQGHHQSCGCLSAEVLSARQTKHGWTKGRRSHPIYNSWIAMRKRCTDPNNASWKWYGARGVTFCERWESFEAFSEDMAGSWLPGTSLDRKDNSKGYSPDNCRWATPAQQQRNVPRNVWVSTPHGVMLLTDAETLWSPREAKQFPRVQKP